MDDPRACQLVSHLPEGESGPSHSVPRLDQLLPSRRLPPPADRMTLKTATVPDSLSPSESTCVTSNAQMKKMLFVASSAPTKLNLMYEAFLDLPDLEIQIIYKTETHSTYYADKRSLAEKVFEKLRLPLDKYGQNKKVVQYVRDNDVGYVFVVKGNQITPRTLRSLKKIRPGLKLISWSQDDMFALHNRSLYYTWAIKYYDLIVTQKSYNCNAEELPALGAKNILFQNKAYLPAIHHPYENCEGAKERHDVLFIGSAEHDRFHLMNYLATNGIEVHIYGSGWDAGYYQHNAHPNMKIHLKALVGEDYARALSCSKITLGFLRKQNRDLQTSRTVEIPACGGFMLAERTAEQHALFTEGIEAEYFSSNTELLEKVHFYLNNDPARQRIANAGRNKCLSADYSYHRRAKDILKVIG